MRCAAGCTSTIEMCSSDGSGSPATSSNRPGSADATPTMPCRSTTNGKVFEAESFSKRWVRSRICFAALCKV